MFGGLNFKPQMRAKIAGHGSQKRMAATGSVAGGWGERYPRFAGAEASVIRFIARYLFMGV
jgi:hypothetical protein